VILTESGQNFLRSARAILAKINESKQELHDGAKEPKRIITVGATPVLAVYLLTPVISKLKRRDPSIKVRVVEDLPWHLLPALSDSLIDVALVGLPVAGREFRTGKIMRQALVVAVPEGHPLAKRSRIRLAELRKDSFLLMNQRFPFRDQVLNMLRGAGVEPDVAFEGSSIANILSMVAAGAGVSLVPEIAAARKDRCRFIPLADPHARFDLGWAMLKNRLPTPEQRLFLRTLKEVSAHRLPAP
jgi:LysR family hydrogen peroxide-inducible transcriptional activator